MMADPIVTPIRIHYLQLNLPEYLKRLMLRLTAGISPCRPTYPGLSVLRLARRGAWLAFSGGVPEAVDWDDTDSLLPSDASSELEQTSGDVGNTERRRLLVIESKLLDENVFVLYLGEQG